MRGKKRADRISERKGWRVYGEANEPISHLVQLVSPGSCVYLPDGQSKHAVDSVMEFEYCGERSEP